MNSLSIVPFVVEQHAVAAAVLWLQCDRAVGDPHYTLGDLSRLNNRMHAHHDGLRVAGDAGWQICLAELILWAGAGETFTAAALALESGIDERVCQVKQVAASSYECSRALVSALGWLSEEQAEPHLNSLLTDASPTLRRIGIAACAVRGRDPGKALGEAVESNDELLRARALRAVGELAGHDLLPAVRCALESSNPRVQFEAAWSVARLTPDERAVQVLKSSVESRSPAGSRALQVALRRMEVSQASEWMNKLAQDQALTRQAVIGTGIVGVPESIPWLLQMMTVPALARVAGEAFTMITGADLTAEKLEGKWPDGFTAGPTEDPDDDNVAMDEDQHLPWPDTAKLTALWTERQGDFQPGTQYLCGKPLTQEWLEHVLWHGYQRQRTAAALELAIKNPGQPLFNVRAPAFRQQQWLGLK